MGEFASADLRLWDNALEAGGAFWDVAVNRGLMVRAFQDQALAEAWVRE
jgi:hypothetical protein